MPSTFAPRNPAVRYSKRGMIGLCEGDGLEPGDEEGGVKLTELGVGICASEVCGLLQHSPIFSHAPPGDRLP